jgi:folate-dependent phosphoribosylglycinamide formyltransferase PurN
MIESLENELDNILQNDNHHRKIINEPDDSDWGQTIIPGKNENTHKTSKGLKILVMASYKLGYLLVKTLIEYETKYPDKLNIVGLITDDPVSGHAKISAKRRIWRLFDNNEKLEMEKGIIELALSAGIPCYTGAVKTNYARKLLKKWNPDTIQVCVFGQIIDEPFINYPMAGIYNYHPADLAHHLGAGPQPFQDLIDRDAKTSLFTIHQLTPQLDSGPVLGQSPTINVRNSNESITHNLLILEDKMTEPLDYMAVILTSRLIGNIEKGINMPISELDFVRYFNEVQKKELMNPIVNNNPDENLPELSKFTIELLDKSN